MLYLVTGGSASGKSAYAESLLLQSEAKHRVYLATMRPWDEECVKRIERHRWMREGKGFSTAEVYGRIRGEELLAQMRPLDCGDEPFGKTVQAALEKTAGSGTAKDLRQERPDAQTTAAELGDARLASAKIFPDTAVLLECMSNLLTNLFYSPLYDREGLAELAASDLLWLNGQVKDLIVVTNEVFSDSEDYDAETELFRRILGRINQALAAEADRVTEVVFGIPVAWKAKESMLDQSVAGS